MAFTEIRGGSPRLQSWVTDNAVSRTGLLLVVAYVLGAFVYQAGLNGLLLEYLDTVGGPGAGATLAFAYRGPTVVAALLTLVAFAAMGVLSVVATRVFVAGVRDRVPREFYTRHIAFVTVNVVAGGFAFALIVFLGTLLLVFPGVFLYVSLVFTTTYVAVDDENFVAAMRHSWRLTGSNRLRVFALLFVLFVLVGVVGGGLAVLVSLLVGRFGGSPALASGLSIVVYLPLSIYLFAVLAAAFDQLRREEADALAR